MKEENPHCYRQRRYKYGLIWERALSFSCLFIHFTTAIIFQPLWACSQWQKQIGKSRPSRGKQENINNQNKESVVPADVNCAFLSTSQQKSCRLLLFNVCFTVKLQDPCWLLASLAVFLSPLSYTHTHTSCLTIHFRPFQGPSMSTGSGCWLFTLAEDTLIWPIWE